MWTDLLRSHKPPPPPGSPPLHSASTPPRPPGQWSASLLIRGGRRDGGGRSWRPALVLQPGAAAAAAERPRPYQCRTSLKLAFFIFLNFFFKSFFFPLGCINYDMMLPIKTSTHTLVHRMQVANNNFAHTGDIRNNKGVEPQLGCGGGEGRRWPLTY